MKNNHKIIVHSIWEYCLDKVFAATGGCWGDVPIKCADDLEDVINELCYESIKEKISIVIHEMNVDYQCNMYYQSSALTSLKSLYND